MAVQKWKLGSWTTLQSAGLNSLASNSLSLGSGFNNVQAGGGGDGYTLCDLELVVQFGTGPTAGAVSVWFLGLGSDGSTYEDGDASTTPGRAADVTFPLRAVATAQRISRRVWLPWGQIKTLVKNDGTGQAFAASGNTLSIRPATPEGV